MKGKKEHIIIIKTKHFWDCECEENNIRSSAYGFCQECKARENECADSRISEVEKLFGTSGMTIGKVTIDPDTDDLILVTGGQYSSGGRVSNHWSWEVLVEGGRYGSGGYYITRNTGHGYGWRGVDIPHNKRTTVELKCK